MERNISGLGLIGRGLVAIAMFAAVDCAYAQTFSELPPGIPTGRWILAPSVSWQFEVDDNIFRQSPDSTFQSGNGISSDQITSSTASLAAYLPVKNSLLSLDYSISNTQYQNNDFPQDTSQDLGVEWVMNLSTNDVVTLRDRFTRSFSELNDIDAGGELVFNGVPFNYNRWDAEWTRVWGKRQSSSARVSRVDFNYQTDDDSIPFFDYRGIESELQWDVILPSSKRLFLFAQTRRFDHYEREGFAIPVGQETRREKSDQFLIGSSGFLGARQRYLVRFGYGGFDYELSPIRPFSGLVGFARWILAIGGRTSLDVVLNRRTLPSNFDTFYVNSEVRLSAEQQLGRFTRAGVILLASENAYGDPIPAITGCATFRRNDERLQIQPFANFQFHERMALQVNATYEDRTSNCSLVEFDYLSARAGLTFGWF